MSYNQNNGGPQQPMAQNGYGYPAQQPCAPQAQAGYPAAPTGYPAQPTQPGQPPMWYPQQAPAQMPQNGYGYPPQQMPAQQMPPQQMAAQPAPAQQAPAQQAQEQKFYTFCEFVPALNEAKNTTYIHVTIEAAVTRCSGLKAMQDGTPYVNFSIPIQNRIKTLDRAFGQGVLQENEKNTVWANCAIFGDSASRFMKVLSNPKHGNPVLLITGNANVKQFMRKDGTSGNSLNININNFLILRDRNGSCMDPNAQQQAPNGGYQSSFGAPTGAPAGYPQQAPAQPAAAQYPQPNPNGFYDVSDMDDGDLPF